MQKCGIGWRVMGFSEVVIAISRSGVTLSNGGLISDMDQATAERTLFVKD
jgi:hypothetical protein